MWLPQQEEGSGLYLNSPTDIVGIDDELYVSDTHNNRIVCLTTGGAPLGVIGARGDGPGQFIYPKGLGVAR